MTTFGRRLDEASAASPDRPPSTRCRFTLTPPRHFLYPAILLLLAEEPRHGYRLMEPLVALGFGPVERPAVYRALADLERDGLISSWSEPAKAGSTRHVHAVTADGQEALETWMSVIARERACLDLVLEKYWYCNAHPLTSAPTPPGQGTTSTEPGLSVQPDDPTASSPPIEPVSRRQRFEVIRGRSVVVVEARSGIGPIAFGTTRVRGEVEVELREGLVAVDATPRAWLEVAVGELSSGNSLYDSEFLTRADARRYPHVVIELYRITRMGDGNRYRLEGDVTFHGVTRRLAGAVTAALLDERTMIVTGEEVIDVRDFDMTLPTMPLLKIYPDVRVHLHVEAGIAS
ncbi:MAG TPA: helix-turn-helix transcriptional regulator [Acidimicrobiales bacterium]|nr:helix-turn-helix transcriptional regulator [Acidimicrobiales bacterium]